MEGEEREGWVGRDGVTVWGVRRGRGVESASLTWKQDLLFSFCYTRFPVFNLLCITH